MNILRSVITLAVVFIVLAIPVHSSQAASVTHLGIPPNDLVTLKVNNATLGCSINPFDLSYRLTFSRVLPDGTMIETFEVPANKLLVVTDVDWVPPGSFSATSSVLVSLSLKNPANDFPWAVFHAAMPPVTDGYVGKNINMTSGFSVSSGITICADVYIVDGPALPPGALTLHGYLVDVK